MKKARHCHWDTKTAPHAPQIPDDVAPPSVYPAAQEDEGDRQLAARQVRMLSVQPSRHAVLLGGWLIWGPSLWPAGPSEGSDDQGLRGCVRRFAKTRVGTREVPLALWALGSCIAALFYAYVASGNIPRCLTLLLYATMCALTVRITCRDPGILPRAWQITQCPRLQAEAERFLYGRGPGTSADSPVCSTCCIMKPEGASHCAVCDACVLGFDHHCGYLGACIGARNHADFLWLLYVGLAAWLLAAQQGLATVCGGTAHKLLLARAVEQQEGGYDDDDGGLAFVARSGKLVALVVDRLLGRVLTNPALGYATLAVILAVQFLFWTSRRLSLAVARYSLGYAMPYEVLLHCLMLVFW
eukprot:SAG31_NODE_8479_length_1444_cov_1.075836_1_plen_355_part_01